MICLLQFNPLFYQGNDNQASRSVLQDENIDWKRSMKTRRLSRNEVILELKADILTIWEHSLCKLLAYLTWRSANDES